MTTSTLHRLPLAITPRKKGLPSSAYPLRRQMRVLLHGVL